jgi:hypothetical protein
MISLVSTQVFLGNNEVTQSMIGNNYVLVNPVSVEAPMDNDAANFLSASGLESDAFYAEAINDFVIELKNYNLWNKLYVSYPLVGLTSQSQAINLANTGSYNITWYSSSFWTFDANGATSDAPNLTFANTNWAPTDAPTLFSNTAHISLYSRTSGSTDVLNNGYDVGGEFTGTQGNQTALAVRNAYLDGNTEYIAGLPTNPPGGVNVSDGLGFFQANRLGDYVVGYKNGNTLISGSLAAEGSFNHNVSFYIGAMHNSGLVEISAWSTRNYAYISIGKGMDEIEAKNYYNVIQKLQTTLGREV